jgi:hypothetical protein
MRVWFRPFALLLVLLLASCEPEQPAPSTSFPPLDFTYLPPLPLNVATVDVLSQYVPSGVPPEVSQYDPVSPVAALRLMATERLKPVGSAGRAVFSIDDAAMVRSGDTVTGAYSVTLSVYTSAGVRAGFAQATVTRQLNIVGEDLPAALYTLTRQLMQQMNVEFEYQVRRSLSDWLLPTAAPAVPQQEPVPPPAPLVTPPTAPPPLVPVPQAMRAQPPPASYGAPPPAPQPMAGPEPALPYPPPPAGPLPEPTTAPPPPSPPLPSALPPAGTLPPPTTTPPPTSPALPAPLPPLGPVQD